MSCGNLATCPTGRSSSISTGFIHLLKTRNANAITIEHKDIFNSYFGSYFALCLLLSKKRKHVMNLGPAHTVPKTSSDHPGLGVVGYGTKTSIDQCTQ